MKELYLKRRIKVLEMTADSLAIQLVSFHLLYHLSNLPANYVLNDCAKNIQTSLLKPRWHLQLDVFRMHLLLAIGCSTFDVNVNDTNILHESAGCDVISARPFSSEMKER